MIRGTTPTFTLTLDDETVDLTDANNVYATFKQNCCTITKTGEDLDISAHQVDVYLDQKETLSFKEGESLEVQLNWTYAEGRRACSSIAKINVNKNLVGTVLP